MSDNQSFFRKFRSRSVKTSFLFIILMTAILAGTSITGIIVVQDNYDSLVNDSYETLDLNERLQKNLLQARETDSDFRNKGDLSMIAEVLEYVNVAIEKGNDIMEIGLNQDIIELAEESIMHIMMYNDTFSSLSQKLTTRGGGVFTSEMGMITEMESHNLMIQGFLSDLREENAINDTANNYFLKYSLTLTNHQQEYLLHQMKGFEASQGYVANFNNTFNEFITAIDSSDAINMTMKMEFKMHLNMYLNSFMGVVNMDNLIREQSDELGHHIMMTEMSSMGLNNAAQDAKDLAVEETTQLISFIILATVIVFVAVMGLSLLLSNSTTRNIDVLIEEVQEIAKGDLTRSISINGNAAKEISILGSNLDSMVTQLSKVVHDINYNSTEVNNTSQSVATAAEEVSASVEEMANTTEQMSVGATEQAQMIQDVLNELIESEQTIINIIEAVKSNTEFVAEIAQETKYLALNARIEASRAGASGRGFSVVAEDVRGLSEQSKMASEEISNTVESISKTLTTLFGTIVEKIENVSSVSEETAASAEELAAITQEIAANMEEVSTSSHILYEMAEDSKNAVSQFKVEK